jgi:hypothetical protein
MTAWNNNSVSIRANPGSFSAGQGAYLYVVDENGNVNSAGYPVTMGSSGNTSSTAGDVNGDRTVNVADLQLVVNDFGKTSSFDQRVDLAIPFGRIDLFDIMIVIRNWGKSS